MIDCRISIFKIQKKSFARFLFFLYFIHLQNICFTQENIERASVGLRSELINPCFSQNNTPIQFDVTLTNQPYTTTKGIRSNLLLSQYSEEQNIEVNIFYRISDKIDFNYATFYYNYSSDETGKMFAANLSLSVDFSAYLFCGQEIEILLNFKMMDGTNCNSTFLVKLFEFKVKEELDETVRPICPTYPSEVIFNEISRKNSQSDIKLSIKSQSLETKKVSNSSIDDKNITQTSIKIASGVNTERISTELSGDDKESVINNESTIVNCSSNATNSVSYELTATNISMNLSDSVINESNINETSHNDTIDIITVSSIANDSSNATNSVSPNESTIVKVSSNDTTFVNQELTATNTSINPSDYVSNRSDLNKASHNNVTNITNVSSIVNASNSHSISFSGVPTLTNATAPFSSTKSDVSTASNNAKGSVTNNARFTNIIKNNISNVTNNQSTTNASTEDTDISSKGSLITTNLHKESDYLFIWIAAAILGVVLAIVITILDRKKTLI